MDETAMGPALTERARRALGSTHTWANFAGFAFLSVALLSAVRGAFLLSHLAGAYHAGLVNHAAFSGLLIGIVIGTLWVVGCNAMLGWIAVRFAGSLETVKLMQVPNASNITRGLQLQHRFWRIEAILLLVSLGLIILAVITIVIAAVLAHR